MLRGLGRTGKDYCYSCWARMLVQLAGGVWLRGQCLGWERARDYGEEEGRHRSRLQVAKKGFDAFGLKPGDVGEYDMDFSVL